MNNNSVASAAIKTIGLLATGAAILAVTATLSFLAAPHLAHFVTQHLKIIATTTAAIVLLGLVTFVFMSFYKPDWPDNRP